MDARGVGRNPGPISQAKSRGISISSLGRAISAAFSRKKQFQARLRKSANPEPDESEGGHLGHPTVWLDQARRAKYRLARGVRLQDRAALGASVGRVRDRPLAFRNPGPGCRTVPEEAPLPEGPFDEHCTVLAKKRSSLDAIEKFNHLFGDSLVDLAKRNGWNRQIPARYDRVF